MKPAVTVPVPPTVKVVEAAEVPAMTSDGEPLVQLANLYPDPAVAVMVMVAVSLYQPAPDGDVDPPEEGLEATVTCHWRE